MDKKYDKYHIPDQGFKYRTFPEFNEDNGGREWLEAIWAGLDPVALYFYGEIEYEEPFIYNPDICSIGRDGNILPTLPDGVRRRMVNDTRAYDISRQKLC